MRDRGESAPTTRTVLLTGPVLATAVGLTGALLVALAGSGGWPGVPGGCSRPGRATELGTSTRGHPRRWACRRRGRPDRDEHCDPRRNRSGYDARRVPPGRVRTRQGRGPVGGPPPNTGHRAVRPARCDVAMQAARMTCTCSSAPETRVAGLPGPRRTWTPNMDRRPGRASGTRPCDRSGGGW